MIKIAIPGRFDGAALGRIGREVLPEGKKNPPKNIQFDFSALNFIEPTGIVFLSNLIKWANLNGSEVNLVGIDDRNKSILYLDDALFFEQHLGKKLNYSSRTRSTTCPLKMIDHSESHAWFERELIPWLSRTININHASLYLIKACCSEIFNNINDHSQQNIGSLFMQYFPATKTISISAADFGVGIPENVRSICPGISDNQAIIQAAKEGFTTKSVPGNRGIGLDYVIRAVAFEYQGAVTIYSAGGRIKFYRSENRIRSFSFKDNGFCPGTTFELSIPTNAIPIITDDPEDMAW